MSGLLNRLFGIDSLQEHSIQGNTPHNIVFGVAMVHSNAINDVVRVVYRGKLTQVHLISE
ncbi:hypothetical protein IPL68_07265 [Candidatus Saccharibacteria bacterium]|nr:MAG: hypothetical protein IPL68_07265 [Candidatus Saccharibacteria bacterium]